VLEVLGIELSSHKNAIYLGFYGQIGKGIKSLQLAPVKLGSMTPEYQTIYKLDNLNPVIQRIHSLRAVKTAGKAEYLMVGGQDHVLMFKVSKMSSMTLFHKFPQVMSGPILDVRLIGMKIAFAGKSKTPLQIVRMGESFTVRQDNINFSTFDKPVLTELGQGSKL
jgi:hypothetical protein